MFAIAKNALTDIAGGFRLRRVWIALAQEDIDDQHRRTTLGPIWLMLNYLIYIGTFIVVFGGGTEIPNFIAYISVGMLVFLFLQEVMTQAVTLFTREESFIAGTTLPLSIYVLRLTMQSLIRTAYATLGCLVILLLVGTPITAGWLWSLPGIAIILLATPAIIILFAMGGAFFPDLQFVVTNVIRVSMFLTPIFWVAASGLRGRLYLYNPLTHFIEVIRSPIVYGSMPLHSLGICVAITLVAWAAALVLLGKFRRQVVFLL